MQSDSFNFKLTKTAIGKIRDVVSSGSFFDGEVRRVGALGHIYVLPDSSLYDVGTYLPVCLLEIDSITYKILRKVA